MHKHIYIYISSKFCYHFVPSLCSNKVAQKRFKTTGSNWQKDLGKFGQICSNASSALIEFMAGLSLSYHTYRVLLIRLINPLQ